MAAVVKLGNDTIVVVTRTPSGQEDDWGNPVLVDSYLPVRWCQVSPATSSESPDRAVPTISGLTVLAPPSTPLGAVDAVIWPATATEDPDNPWTGPRYEVVGDPGDWGTAVQAHLQRSR